MPLKREVVLAAILELAGRIGPERVIWRYDPLLFGEHYSPQWHAEQFGKMARLLEGATHKCVFSFYDSYASSDKRLAPRRLRGATAEEMQATAAPLAQQADIYHLRLESCAEDVNLSRYGIAGGACVDAGLLQQIAGRPIPAQRDKNQRPACHCAASVDIGAYNTCPGGCLYCYASHGNASRAKAHFNHFDETSCRLDSANTD